MTEVQRRGPGARADANHPTRLELLDAAAALAERDGVSALSVQAITRAAGHAKGTFYVHFADRTELLVQLHRRFHDELFDRIRREVDEGAPGPDRARTRIVAFLDGCRAQPGVRSMLFDARATPEIAGLARQRNEEAAGVLAADLGGHAPRPAETATLLVAATIEVAVRELRSAELLPELRAALLSLIPDA